MYKIMSKVIDNATFMEYIVIKNETERRKMMKKEMHKPYNKLKGFLREHMITYGEIAKTLGITESAVANKLNGRSDFYLREIEILLDQYESFSLDKIF